MKPSRRSLVLAMALGAASFTTPVTAEDLTATTVAYQDNDGSQARIAISGKLRMLSQSVPSAACHFAAGIDTQTSQARLAADTAAFTKILRALELGDPNLGVIGVEKRAKTLVKIREVQTIWAPLETAAAKVIAGEDVDQNLDLIIDASMSVLDASKALVLELSGQYTNPYQMVQADAFLIDISGRQRMLTQQMAKDSCILATGRGSAETAEALQTSMRVFESSLSALQNGMPSAGIQKPPTAEISDALKLVAASWKHVKPSLVATLETEALDAAREAETYQGLNTTMEVMNDVVKMYTNASVQGS